MVSQFFHVFYSLGPILGFPEQVQSLINCKFVIKKGIRARDARVCMTCIHKGN